MKIQSDITSQVRYSLAANILELYKYVIPSAQCDCFANLVDGTRDIVSCRFHGG